MSKIILAGSDDGVGSVTVVAPNTNSNQTLTLENATGTLAPLVLGTPRTASGTNIDFTGIPSWVNRITITIYGMSTSGASNWLLRAGTGGVVATTGYNAASSTNEMSTLGTTYYTNGFGIRVNSGAYVIHGNIVLVKHNDVRWMCSHQLAGDIAAIHGSGGVALAGPLDILRLTTVNGTDTFDAGTINIMYE